MAISIGAIEGVIKLTNQFSPELDDIGRDIEEAGKKWKKAGQQFNDVGRIFLPVTAVIAGSAALASKAAIDFESAFAGVRKTVEASENQLAALHQGFRDMAKSIPITAVELARIGETAGQLGIQTENILSFTRVMADLGVATNLSATEAATALARFVNIMGTSEADFDKLGSVIVQLGNNVAATEEEIVKFSLRLAGAGLQAGLSEADILGLGATLASLGLRAEAGGTALSKVMIRIDSAISRGGDRLNEFAEIAGKTGEDFREIWDENAARGLIMFVEGLSKMEQHGKTTFEALEDLNLVEIRMRDSLLRTTNAGQLLNDTLFLAQEEWKRNIALTVEAEKRYSTTASKIQVLKNRLTDIGITMGETLLPVIQDMVDSIEGMLPAIQQTAAGFNALDSRLKKIIIIITALVAGFGPFLILVGHAMQGFGALLFILDKFNTTLLFIVKRLGAVGAIITALIFIVQQATSNFARFAEEQKRAADEAKRFAEGIRLDIQRTDEAIKSSSFKEVSDRISDMSFRLDQLRDSTSAAKDRLGEISQELENTKKAFEDGHISTDLALQITEELTRERNNLTKSFNDGSVSIERLENHINALTAAMNLLLSSGDPTIRQQRLMKERAEELRKEIRKLVAEIGRQMRELDDFRNNVSDNLVGREGIFRLDRAFDELEENFFDMEGVMESVDDAMKTMADEGLSDLDEALSGIPDLSDEAIAALEALRLEYLAATVDFSTLAKQMSRVFGDAFESMIDGVGSLVNDISQLIDLFKTLKTVQADAAKSALAAGALGAGIGDTVNRFAGGSTAAGIFGSIGAIAGNFAGGPANAQIGAVIASAIGSLIKESVPRASTLISGTGFFSVSGGGSVRGSVESLADAIVSGVNQLLSSVGSMLTDLDVFRVGARGDRFFVKLSDSAAAWFDSIEEAAEFAIIAAVQRSDSTGFTDTVAKIIDNALLAGSLDKLQSALDVAFRLDLGALATDTEREWARIQKEFQDGLVTLRNLVDAEAELRAERDRQLDQLGESLESQLRSSAGIDDTVKSLLSLVKEAEAFNDIIMRMQESAGEAGDQFELTQEDLDSLAQEMRDIGRSEEQIRAALERFRRRAEEASGTLADMIPTELIEQAIQRVSDSIETDFLQGILNIIEDEQLAMHLTQLRRTLELENLRLQLEMLHALGRISEEVLQQYADALDRAADAPLPGTAGDTGNPIDILGEIGDALNNILPGFDSLVTRVLELQDRMSELAAALFEGNITADEFAEAIDNIEKAMQFVSDQIEIKLLDSLLRWIDDAQLAARLQELRALAEIAQMRLLLDMLRVMGRLTEAQIAIYEEAIDRAEDIIGSGAISEGRRGGGRRRSVADQVDSILDRIFDKLQQLTFGPSSGAAGPSLAASLKRFRQKIGSSDFEGILDSANFLEDALERFTGGGGPVFERIMAEIREGLAQTLQGTKFGNDPLVNQLIKNEGAINRRGQQTFNAVQRVADNTAASGAAITNAITQSANSRDRRLDNLVTEVRMMNNSMRNERRAVPKVS